MIVVKVTADGITVDGHAGYAEAGKDIVCAAVSVLAQNLIGSIEALTGDKIQYQIEGGHIDIKYEDLSEQGELLVDSFFLGICVVAAQYPDYVRVI